MHLSVVGISHRTAPVALREKISFSPTQLEKSLGWLKKASATDEALILSTCNRTEIYYCSTQNNSDWCADFLSDCIGQTDLRPYLYCKQDRAAIEHLFNVASGLDSMVVGENEILKQVKDAYHTCHQLNLTGKLLNVLFQRALYVGKLVRTHTGISQGALSVGSVAVSLAEKIFGDLTQSSVLIFGAGKMAEVSARYLLSKKVKQLSVANRTLENAQALAARFEAEPLTLEQGFERMVSADIVISSMAATEPILRADFIKTIMERRAQRSLFIIDIAVPRNIETTAHQLDNVYVYNIDDLQQLVQDNLRLRAGAMQQANGIVAQKTEEFHHWFKALKEGDEKSLKHRFETAS